ncbi:MAG: hypothetical protein WA146_10340 [Thiobacillus sp.]|nr:hypothetical protein [Thiobacillus sp.]MDO9385450.1 hypothetical protein [Thiobacillus sp.]
MVDGTRKPAKAKPATRTARTTTAVRARPVARARAAKAAAPAAGSAAATVRSAAAKAAAAKKAAVRPPVARKSPPAKKTPHKPEPIVAKAKKAGKPAKTKKPKLVRDSFTMPDGEYALIAALKKRCLDAGVSVKKSEILRAAVANLAKLSDASVLAAVRRLEVIKTGRPAKGSK